MTWLRALNPLCILWLRHWSKLNLAAGYAVHVDAYATDPLTELMEGEVKTFLGIPDTVTWGGQSNDVFSAQSGDFMKPVIDIGEFDWYGYR